MLNVAVSRAKDCFIVFGNRDIFNEKGNTPSAKLYRFLKESEL
jgi:superfamily I DNA and/or RNA helicase